MPSAAAIAAAASVASAAREIDHPQAVAKPVRDLDADLDGEPGLPGSARSDEGDGAGVFEQR